MQYTVTNLPEVFEATVRKQSFKVDLPADLPSAAVRKIFEYGLQRILNDASASAESPKDAIALAQKRWDSLKAGEIRQTAQRTGDPVAKEAMRLAVVWVQSNAKFKAWASENGLKAADKEYTEKLRELATARKEAFVDQAKENLAKVAAIEVDDLDI